MKIKMASLLLFVTMLLLSSCEERFQPELITSDPLLVVEGHIEVASEIPLPPYVLLTRTLPFYEEITTEDVSNLFVHNAYVEVSDGNESVVLEEVCWEDLPEEFREIALETLPDLTDIEINYCIYTDLSFSFMGEIGKTYNLLVETDKEVATATTTIPDFVPLDSMYFVPAPGGYGDSLFEMRIAFADPEQEDNFYRYMTSTDQGPFYPGFSSVFNDLLFAGQAVDFPLTKGEPPFQEELEEGETETRVYGLYRPGEEVVLRWLMIDAAHYKFWDTLEFNKVNQGPFGSYTQVKSNVEGAVGIWGGYASGFYEGVVE